VKGRSSSRHGSGVRGGGSANAKPVDEYLSTAQTVGTTGRGELAALGGFVRGLPRTGWASERRSLGPVVRLAGITGYSRGRAAIQADSCAGSVRDEKKPAVIDAKLGNKSC
jgi:hypothetical protein